MVRIIILIIITALGISAAVVLSLRGDETDDMQAIQAGAVIGGVEAGIDDRASSSLDVIFSVEETFHDTYIVVELSSSNPDAKIYYTLDGSHPGGIRSCNPEGFTAGEMLYCHHDNWRCVMPEGMPIPALGGGQDPYCYVARPTSSRAVGNQPEPPMLYTDDNPILFFSDLWVTAATIRAIAVIECDKTGDITSSPVFTKSYIIGTDVWTRFTPETFIFVLSADPYDLACYYHGVSIRGFRRDQFFGHADPPACANFNMRGRESERDFFVTVFDSLGNTLIHQAAGGRIQGGWSRDATQKSWRLIARREYSNGKFSFPFFDDTFNSYGQLMTRFDRLILRNGANDREHAGLRDEVAGRMAKLAGFPDVQSFAPAAVFLNGRYYGSAWLKESLCEGYLAQKYGGLKDNYEIIRRTEAGGQGNQRAVNDWEQIYELALRAVDEVHEGTGIGFNDDTMFEEFTSQVDIDNFMLYYAIQTYIDNRDWPGNNLKLWRYYPEEDEVVPDTFNDGKWRFLMYDIEFALGIYGQGNNANTLGNVLRHRDSRNNPHMGGHSELLQAVLQRPDMQEYFANTISDLISGAFSTAGMNAVLDEVSALGNPELFNAMRESTVNMWDLFGNREQIRDFARRRPHIFYHNMGEIFGIPDVNDMYTVSVTGAIGATAWVNTRRVTGNENIRGSYLAHYTLPIRADIAPGFEFASWEIGGVHYYEPDMRISADMADTGGVVAVTLHTNRLIEGAPLLITAINSGSGADRIELYNPNEVSVSTRDLFLSDRGDNLRRWKIPTITIPPQETLVIVMSNNRTPDALMKPQASFSLSAGETLYLACITDGILAAVSIPDTEYGETMRRQEDGTYEIVIDTE